MLYKLQRSLILYYGALHLMFTLSHKVSTNILRQSRLHIDLLCWKRIDLCFSRFFFLNIDRTCYYVRNQAVERLVPSLEGQGWVDLCLCMYHRDFSSGLLSFTTVLNFTLVKMTVELSIVWILNSHSERSDKSPYLPADKRRFWLLLLIGLLLCMKNQSKWKYKVQCTFIFVEIRI